MILSTFFVSVDHRHSGQVIRLEQIDHILNGGLGGDGNRLAVHDFSATVGIGGEIISLAAEPIPQMRGRRISPDQHHLDHAGPGSSPGPTKSLAITPSWFPDGGAISLAEDGRRRGLETARPRARKPPTIPARDVAGPGGRQSGQARVLANALPSVTIVSSPLQNPPPPWPYAPVLRPKRSR